jgi:hypothetical protein
MALPPACESVVFLADAGQRELSFAIDCWWSIPSTGLRHRD